MNIKIKYDNFEKLDYILTNPNYLKIYSKEFGWICGYNEKEVLLYVIPFMKKKKWFFTYMQIQSDTIFIKGSSEQEQLFLDKAIEKLKVEKEFDFISQPKTNVVFNSYPKGAIYSPFGSYIIDLSFNEDSLWGNIHSKHKNVIKRAIKNGAIVRFGKSEFNTAYNTISETLSRNNMVMIEENKLKELLNTNEKNFLIGCSYIDDNPQGAVIILFDNYKGYYFWGGTNIDLSLGTNNLLHWEVIKQLKVLGVKYYDFVGARLNTKDQRLLGIQRFKSRFGSILKQGYLWKYPIKKWKYKLFTILYRYKMKKGDIIDQEKDNINF